MFYVYVVKSETTGKIYIGYTSNLEVRLKRHNQELPTKKESYTYLNKGPWQTVYKEEYKTRQEAIKREKQLKSAGGRKFIKAILKTSIEV
ncbi:endonuclease [Candidatus Shapirobacteria bacterium CG_4_9_14_0_2_um_filter_39_11]|uniref:Endonuclease n=1 Tax=Candidatus Shapirobacteria bacterium CG_4_9_14_0_2_um_filter_39_11 TaxID=1974478 RepID=A0A2M8EST5_9BACT|nr:MAG: endonuclease [Candidatus Shapirobacteria bacterium CG_4_9_14_0_2_um_filter_39_11]